MMQVIVDRLSLFHLASRRFNLDVGRALPRVVGEPWAWAERMPQGCTHGRVGRFAFSFHWGR